MKIDRKGKCRCTPRERDGWTVCNSCADLAFRVYRFVVDLSTDMWYNVSRQAGDGGYEVDTLRQLEFVEFLPASGGPTGPAAASSLVQGED